MNFQHLLGPAARTLGVRGALVVSREDGLVVAQSPDTAVNGLATAALAASLAGRVARLTEILGQAEPMLVELQGQDGILLAAPAPEGLLLVAVAAPATDTARLRGLLLEAAERAD